MKHATLHSIAAPARERSAFPARPGDSVIIRTFLPGYNQLPASVVQNDRLLIPDRIPVTPTRRLVVLIPEGEIDNNALARRIWQLASSSGLSILYLALLPDHKSTYQSRRLATLASLTASRESRPQTSVSQEKSWFKAVEKILRAGDVLICLKEHQLSRGVFFRKTLGEMLSAATAAPVYMLGGLEIVPNPQSNQITKTLLAWTVSISLMVVFFILQIVIDRFSVQPASTWFQFISVVVEIYLLWKVNEWINEIL
jgi:hypothetical protein